MRAGTRILIRVLWRSAVGKEVIVFFFLFLFWFLFFFNGFLLCFCACDFVWGVVCRSADWVCLDENFGVCFVGFGVGSSWERAQVEFFLANFGLVLDGEWFLCFRASDLGFALCGFV